MTRLAPFALVSVLAACGGSPSPSTPAKAKVTLDVYAAEESNVNAYVVSDGAGAIVIDATRNADDGARLAEQVKARTAGPVTVLITHGHPDHFLGLGAVRAALPDARFVVARPEIKEDLLGMVGFMASQGWLAKLPAMLPRSAEHPDGFDYAGEIEVLAEPRLALPGGAALELTTDYPATEAAHMTTVYSPDLDALFTSDLAYRDVHLWLGVGVTRASAQAWQDTLDGLARTWGERRPTVYPGHGAATDVSVFADDKVYIGDLLAVTASAPSDQAAIDAMVAKYPGHANRDFILMMSVANLRQQR